MVTLNRQSQPLGDHMMQTPEEIGEGSPEPPLPELLPGNQRGAAPEAEDTSWVSYQV